jgi:hypothetical protein
MSWIRLMHGSLSERHERHQVIGAGNNADQRLAAHDRQRAESGGKVAIHPNVFCQIMEDIPANGWRIVKDVERLTLLVSGLHQLQSLEENLLDSLRKLLVPCAASPLPIQFRQVETIPKGASAKAPLIHSNV